MTAYWPKPINTQMMTMWIIESSPFTSVRKWSCIQFCCAQHLFDKYQLIHICEIDLSLAFNYEASVIEVLRGVDWHSSLIMVIVGLLACWCSTSLCIGSNLKVKLLYELSARVSSFKSSLIVLLHSAYSQACFSFVFTLLSLSIVYQQNSEKFTLQCSAPLQNGPQAKWTSKWLNLSHNGLRSFFQPTTLGSWIKARDSKEGYVDQIAGQYCSCTPGHNIA